MSYDKYNVTDPKRFIISKGDDLCNSIILALGGYPLNLPRSNWEVSTMTEIEKTSEYRKLRWALKCEVKYVVIYTQVGDCEEWKEFFNEFRTKYGSQVSWKKSARKYSETKVVKVYTNEVLEYKEVTSIDSLNFMIIPNHIWNEIYKKYESLVGGDHGEESQKA